MCVCTLLCVCGRHGQLATGRNNIQHPTPTGPHRQDKMPSQQANEPRLNPAQSYTYAHTYIKTHKHPLGNATTAVARRQGTRGTSVWNWTRLQQSRLSEPGGSMYSQTHSIAPSLPPTHTQANEHTHGPFWLIYCQQPSKPNRPDQQLAILSYCREASPTFPQLQFWR